MFSYQEFLDSIDRKAYHEGEWQWEEDGYTCTRTYHYSPPGCHTSCGIIYYVKNGKVEFVEGDPLDPCANGKLCIRCLNRVEAINNPDRVKYPMKRDPQFRGDNSKWERISWDEAFDIAEAKIKEVWEKWGAHCILATNGTGRNIQWQMPFFYKGILKTPNVSTIGFTGFACYLPRTCGSGGMGDIPIVDASEGHELRYADPTWERPEVIAVWGNEPLAANADGYLGHWLAVCVQLGTKIISVDPRLTWWGVRAQYHLQLRPGTDAALACAWLHVIIEEQLYDYDFVSCWTTGFEIIQEKVKDCTPEWAAEICGVPAEDIAGSARLFANAKNAAIQWGLAMDQQLGCMSLNLACVDIMALTGNIDVPGGWILMQNAFKVAASHDNYDILQNPESTKMKATMHLVFGTPGEDFIPHASCDALIQLLETDEPYGFKLLWCQSGNPLSCSAMDAPRMYAAMNRIPYIIYIDPFMTPTATALADLFMPVSMSAERDSARAWWTPIRTMRKVASYYEAKSDEEIIVEMGRRLDPEHFPWKTDVELINAFLSPGTGFTQFATQGLENKHDLVDESDKFEWYGDLRGLQEHKGYAYDKFNGTYKKYEKGMLRPDGSPGFATASGRVELSPSCYTLWGLTPWPFHTEPAQSPISTPELYKEYPLVLSGGARSFEFFHSEDRQEPTMRELHPWPLAWVHPDDAKTYGIRDGQWIWVENDHGRFMQKAKITPAIRKNTVMCEHGWWFPERSAEDGLFGTFDSNLNNCTVMHETAEGGCGSSIKSMLCKIYPYKEGDELPGQVVLEHGGWNEIIPGEPRGKQVYVEPDRKA